MILLYKKLFQRARWIVSWWVSHVLQWLPFPPVQRNRILLSSHSGLGYFCNPRYISEYLIEHWGQDIEVVWAFKHPEKYKNIPKIKAIKIPSLKWLYYTDTAAVAITNTGFPKAQPKREGQLFIQTWHGGGAYKRVGFGVAYDQSRKEKRVAAEDLRKIDLFVSSSRQFSEYAIRQDFAAFRGEILACGMPRNDLLLNREKREDAARRVREKLGVTGYIALYAPTFRGHGMVEYRTPDLTSYKGVLSALERRFGGPAYIMKRAHPGTLIDGGIEDHVMDVSDYPDMQGLLCAADMLITDYSSSMWDFSLLGRPCLLYMPDLEDYAATRGICTPPEEWPGIVCRTEEELIEAILTLDVEEYARKAAEYVEAAGSYETGTATRQICERIMAHIESGKPGHGEQ